MRAALCLGVFFFIQPISARAEGSSIKFPSVDEILAPVPGMPAVDEELRDAPISPPDLAWFRAEMGSSNSHRRRTAALAFGTPKNLSAIPRLGAALSSLNETGPVRAAAAQALGRVGGSWAGSFLIRALDDCDERVRFSAVLALGRINGEGNAARLEKVLRSDPSWWVRYAAAAAMGSAGKAFTAGWLERAIREDGSWQVRFEASWALGELKTQHAAEILAEALRDREASVRCAAALALARIHGPQASSILDQALRSEEDGGVRSILAMALNKSDPLIK